MLSDSVNALLAQVAASQVRYLLFSQHAYDQAHLLLRVQAAARSTAPFFTMALQISNRFITAMGSDLLSARTSNFLGLQLAGSDVFGLTVRLLDIIEPFLLAIL